MPPIACAGGGLGAGQRDGRAAAAGREQSYGSWTVKRPTLTPCVFSSVWSSIGNWPLRSAVNASSITSPAVTWRGGHLVVVAVDVEDAVDLGGDDQRDVAPAADGGVGWRERFGGERQLDLGRTRLARRRSADAAGKGGGAEEREQGANQQGPVVTCDEPMQLDLRGRIE